MAIIVSVAAGNISLGVRMARKFTFLIGVLLFFSVPNSFAQFPTDCDGICVHRPRDTVLILDFSSNNGAALGLISNDVTCGIIDVGDLPDGMTKRNFENFLRHFFEADQMEKLVFDVMVFNGETGTYEVAIRGVSAKEFDSSLLDGMPNSFMAVRSTDFSMSGLNDVFWAVDGNGEVISANPYISTDSEK